MDETSIAQTRDGQLLSAAVRTIRKARGMTTRETAAGMNMSTRSYQRFEAGATRMNLDHIHRFATVTQSDPHAIVMAIAIGAPDFALHSADNKIGTVITVGLQRFEQALGPRIAELDTRTLVGAIAAMFDRLTEDVLNPDPTKTWLATGQAELSARRPKPGR